MVKFTDAPDEPKSASPYSVQPSPKPRVVKPKIDSLELKGITWCIKQAFSAYNSIDRRTGKPKTNWDKPHASGEMILAAERFLRKQLSAKEYLKVFHVAEWGLQYE